MTTVLGIHISDGTNRWRGLSSAVRTMTVAVLVTNRSDSSKLQLNFEPQKKVERVHLLRNVKKSLSCKIKYLNKILYGRNALNVSYEVRMKLCQYFYTARVSVLSIVQTGM